MIEENKKVEKEKEETELQKMTTDRNCLWQANEDLLNERNALQDRLNELEEKESQDELWEELINTLSESLNEESMSIYDIEKAKTKFSIYKK